MQRIILANEPRLVREMLRRVLSRVPNLIVIGEYTNWARLLWTVAHTEAQWVIVSFPSNGRVPAIVELLLMAKPGLRILAVASDGSETRLITGETHIETVEPASLDTLVALLTFDAEPINEE